MYAFSIICLEEYKMHDLAVQVWSPFDFSQLRNIRNYIKRLDVWSALGSVVMRLLIVLPKTGLFAEQMNLGDLCCFHPWSLKHSGTPPVTTRLAEGAFWQSRRAAVSPNTPNPGRGSFCPKHCSSRSGLGNKCSFSPELFPPCCQEYACARASWLIAILVSGSKERQGMQGVCISHGQFPGSPQKGRVALWPRSWGHPAYTSLSNWAPQELRTWACELGVVGEASGRKGYELNSQRWTLTDWTTEIPIPFSWVSWKHHQISWSIISVSSSS